MRTLMLSTLFLMLLVADPLSAAVTSVDTTHMEKLSEEIIAMTASKDYAAKSLQLYNEANAANSEKYRFNALKALSRLYFN